MIIKQEEFMIRRVDITLPSIKHGKDLKLLNNDIILYATTNHNNNIYYIYIYIIEHSSIIYFIARFLL